MRDVPCGDVECRRHRNPPDPAAECTVIAWLEEELTRPIYEDSGHAFWGVTQPPNEDHPACWAFSWRPPPVDEPDPGRFP